MKSRKLIVILFVVLGVVLVVYFATTQTDNSLKYQWNESYEVESDQPYGTKFIQKLLERHRPGRTFTLHDNKPLRDALDTAVLKVKTDYIFIGNEIHLSDMDRASLLDYVSRGNDAFIATTSLPFDVLDDTNANLCENVIFLSMNEQMLANLNFVDEELRSPKGYEYRYRFGRDDRKYYWSSLSEEFVCDSVKVFTSLGVIEQSGTNFFRIDHGEGHLYLHTNPIVFTNYFMTDREKTEYASNVFSHLTGDGILWDEYSRSQFAPENNAPPMSPVSYILRQESLRYAWWLMLFAVVLYTLFTAKRRQRIVPVVLAKNNASLEFLGMVSALHLQNGNHHNMGRKKMKYFFHFVKSKYGMQAHTLSESFVQRLAAKSKVDVGHLKLIWDAFYHLESRADFDEEQLANLHGLLEEFYRNCK